MQERSTENFVRTEVPAEDPETVALRDRVAPETARLTGRTAMAPNTSAAHGLEPAHSASNSTSAHYQR